MKVLLLIGAVLIAIGMAGSAAACYGTAIFDDAEATRTASDLSGPLLAPLAGLTLAIGLVCVGIGVGNWRRPIPSDVRPANPWSDQPGEHGDPPKGLV